MHYTTRRRSLQGRELNFYTRRLLRTLAHSLVAAHTGPFGTRVTEDPACGGCQCLEVRRLFCSNMIGHNGTMSGGESLLPAVGRVIRLLANVEPRLAA
jgi:hypothetical protein